MSQNVSLPFVLVNFHFQEILGAILHSLNTKLINSFQIRNKTFSRQVTVSYQIGYYFENLGLWFLNLCFL